MVESVVLDELHVTFRMPSDLPAARSEELGVTLRSTVFMTQLQGAIRRVVMSYPEFAVVTITVAR